MNSNLERLAGIATIGTVAMVIAALAVAILGWQFDLTENQVTGITLLLIAGIVGFVLLFSQDEGTEPSDSPFVLPSVKIPRVMLGISISLNISTNQQKMYRAAWAV